MKKLSIKKSLISLLVAFVLCLPIFALAETSTIINPLASKNITNINSFLKTILEGAITIGIPVIALAIIYSGFLFVEARGNSEKLGKAKSSLMYTLIGAAILIGAWTIAQLISDTILQIK